MVLKPEPVFAAFDAIPARSSRRVLLMSPQGVPLHQDHLRRWAVTTDQLILICGHYEGFDERIRTQAHAEVSIGDYVLTNGALPAMVVIDAVARLLPGVLGNEASSQTESFSDGLLEAPQYTRPRVYRDWAVPEVLLSGHHARIQDWRDAESRALTAANRPDLLESKDANEGEQG